MQRYVDEAFAVPGAGSQVEEADVAVGAGGSREVEAEVEVLCGIGARADGGGRCGRVRQRLRYVFCLGPTATGLETSASTQDTTIRG